MGVFIFVVILIGLTVWLSMREPYDTLEITLVFLLMGGIGIVPVGGLTGGLMPTYSVGSRDGYVTKLSRKGIVFKTYEGELQVGTGNMAALQEPFSYSIADPELTQPLSNYASNGTRIRLRYREYLIPNWREGSSRHIVTSVEVLPSG